MTSLSSTSIKELIVRRYPEPFRQRGLVAATVPENFDLLLEGVIDSLGLMELISEIEREFAITVDLEGLDADKLTLVGPLADYISKTAKPPGAGA
ncbi:MAG: acyl carrier protein [Verrucomicrobiales bacterium]|nr:acyl carrier protein [Verrucomicrobiales bacterium]